MPVYVALLRAVNVGGTGKLPMTRLVAMCRDAGFERAQTYIASGNVVFFSGKSEAAVKRELETRLEAFAGKPVGVMVRTASGLAEVLASNPFPDASPTYTVAIFLNRAPPRNALQQATGARDEVMQLGKREVYVHYPSGQGRSKLKIPDAKDGTARNMNTIARLVEIASRL